MKCPRFLLSLLMLGLALPASSEPTIGVQVQLLSRWRDAPPRFLRSGVLTPHGFMGSVRFFAPLSSEQIAAWTAKGVEFTRLTGRADHVGRVYAAHIRWDGLEALKQSESVERVEAELIMPPVRPLETTRDLTESPAAAGQALLQGEGAGTGQIIVDIDSGIDPFHPSLFKADGGVYGWVDVDGNGLLTPGIDAIDLDGNGVADAGETVRLLEPTIIDWANGGEEPDGTLQPKTDWLYADANGNGRRDYGPDFGYDDATPGFGEAMFLVDDANDNGTLDKEERLFRLGSSKIVGALIRGESYLRDDNLTDLTLEPVQNGQPQEAHGHSVAGILVGGTPGLSRFVGMAPDAEVIMVGSRDQSGNQPFDPNADPLDPTISALAWAKDLGADIALYEFSSWGSTAMDGTSNLEVAMDELHWNDRISNVCPAGNLAEAGKHTEGNALPAGTEVGFTLPDKWYDNYPFQSQVVIFSLYWKGLESALSMQLEVPGGASVTVQYGSGFAIGDYFGQCALNVSSANMVHTTCYLYTDGASMPSGYYRATLTSTTGAAVPYHAYLNDAISGWARGVSFQEETTTSTICHPATANTGITVGAYGGRFGAPAEIGALRGYSSRGPRIDGERGLDITAPDDPYAPLPTIPAGAFWPNSPEIQAGFQVFGGTSGAGPHVAGAVALVRQLHPDWPAERIKQEVQLGALTEDAMGELPNPGWGFGKIAAYQVATGTAWPGNIAPVASVELAERSGLSVQLTATGSSDADDGADALQARWDWNYDGEWDTAFGALTGEHIYELSDGESMAVTARVQVRDPKGYVDVAVVEFTVADDAPPTTADDSPENDAGSTGGEADANGGGTGADTTGGSNSGTNALAGSGDSGGCSTGGPRGSWPFGLTLLLSWVALLTLRRRSEV